MMATLNAAVEALSSVPVLIFLGAASLGAWLWLTFAHAAFWRATERLTDAAEPKPWPEVVAVVPARNEADVIVRSLGSLLDQDYPGAFRAVLVDDHSTDGTGSKAQGLAGAHPRGDRAVVAAAEAMPAGWVGKMWAVASGIEKARELAPGARYLLLTDADIAHPPDALRRLVALAEARQLDLVSLMVRLDCRHGWERLLIPAFVYFFQKLYPFRRVNNPRTRIAAAAGGCMLVRAESLEAAGGIAAIRNEIIDDCALARNLKRGGSIWLGLAEKAHSIRPYGGLPGIWHMVARTAYTQLRYNLALLVGTVLGLALLYVIPPVLALTWPIHGEPAAALLGAAAWLVLTTTFRPTLKLYRQPLVLAPLLPLAGILYLAMTLDSARRHLQGRGGEWKGRAMAGHRDGSPL